MSNGAITRDLLIYCVAALHVLQGGALLVASEAATATPVRLLTSVLPAWLVGMGFLIAGVATWARQWWAALPQQAFLSTAFLAAIVATWQGAYLDGTVIPRAHIFVDQAVYIILALAYPVAVWNRYRVC